MTWSASQATRAVVGAMLTLTACAPHATAPAAPETIAHSTPLRLGPKLERGSFTSPCLLAYHQVIVGAPADAGEDQWRAIISTAAKISAHSFAPYFAFLPLGRPPDSLEGATLRPVGTVPDAADTNPLYAPFPGQPLVQVLQLSCVPLDRHGQPLPVYSAAEEMPVHYVPYIGP